MDDIYDILQMDSVEKTRDEVWTILKMISPQIDIAPISDAFDAIVSLYKGTYPGYRGCNTEYHNIHHIINTFLAMARIIHGGVIHGLKFKNRHIVLGLIAALFHDTGYIQESNDTKGTGAKYTITHVLRSMDFLEHHGKNFGLTKEEITAGRFIIYCTDFAVAPDILHFPFPETDMLGKMLAVSDIMAQMSDRMYLEKLRLLYYEFKEGLIDCYKSEEDLLKKTICFFSIAEKRLETLLANNNLLMQLHFKSRWGISDNLYLIAKDKQKNYLNKILSKPDILAQLKRGGTAIEDKIEQLKKK